MFHSLFFHPDLNSCHCHDALANAMTLAAAFKVDKTSNRVGMKRGNGNNILTWRKLYPSDYIVIL